MSQEKEIINLETMTNKIEELIAKGYINQKCISVMQDFADDLNFDKIITINIVVILELIEEDILKAVNFFCKLEKRLQPKTSELILKRTSLYSKKGNEFKNAIERIRTIKMNAWYFSNKKIGKEIQL